MTLFSELPAFTIDQILGHLDSSYLVIKLWLCGSTELNSKLAKGLTFLDLKPHPCLPCRIPLISSKLQALRYFSLSSEASVLAYHPLNMPQLLHSLPKTLEYLNLSNLPWNISELASPNHLDASTATVELATLFPNLRTLKASNLTSEIFSMLPTSLTRLEGPLVLNYTKRDSVCHLSKLPRKIQHLTGPVQWIVHPEASGELVHDFSAYNTLDEAVDAMRLDFSKAPPTLETLATPHRPLKWAKDSELESSSYESWLPKSLLNLNWTQANCPFSPSLARTLPPRLQTLALGNIDIGSFSDSLVHYLPASLTELCVALPRRKNNAFPLDLAKASFWPSKLARLELMNFWLCSSDIAHLPRTVTSLEIYVKSNFDSSLLPPMITSLDIVWNTDTTEGMRFDRYPLVTCSLDFCEGIMQLESCFEVFPSTLKTLKLRGTHLIPPTEAHPINPGLLPNFTSLEVLCISIGLFQHIPRSTQRVNFQFLSGVSSSSLIENGDIFKGLPPSLKALKIQYNYDLADGTELPPQKLDHLPSLSEFIFCNVKFSTAMLKNLPRSITHLEMQLDLQESDFASLPPHLKECSFTSMPDEIALALVKYLPLAVLASHNKFFEDDAPALAEAARARVQQAITNM